jgi:hypothetical protein
MFSFLVKEADKKYFLTPLSSTQNSSLILHIISSNLSYLSQVEKNQRPDAQAPGLCFSDPS